MPIIEQFVALMYQKFNHVKNCHRGTKREPFIKDSRNLEKVPPTAVSLYQHTLRAAHDAGWVWCQALLTMLILQNFEN